MSELTKYWSQRYAEYIKNGDQDMWSCPVVVSNAPLYVQNSRTGLMELLDLGDRTRTSEDLAPVRVHTIYDIVDEDLDGVPSCFLEVSPYLNYEIDLDTTSDETLFICIDSFDRPTASNMAFIDLRDDMGFAVKKMLDHGFRDTHAISRYHVQEQNDDLVGDLTRIVENTAHLFEEPFDFVKLRDYLHTSPLKDRDNCLYVMHEVAKKIFTGSMLKFSGEAQLYVDYAEAEPHAAIKPIPHMYNDKNCEYVGLDYEVHKDRPTGSMYVYLRLYQHETFDAFCNEKALLFKVLVSDSLRLAKSHHE